MYNLSKKLDPSLSVSSSQHDDPTKDRLDAASIECTTSSEPVTEVGSSISPNSVCDCSMDQPEMLASEKVASELNAKDVTSDTVVRDLVEVQPPEMVVTPVTSELISKAIIDGMPSSIKNGYHCDIDKMTCMTLSKLGSAHSNTVLNGPLSENGHIVLGDIDDYERLARLCLSGKSGTPVVK